MRIGAMVLGILGSVINLIFGGLWILGAAASHALNDAAQGQLINDDAATAQGRAGYLLIAGIVAAIVGVVFAARGNGKVAAGVLILAALAPAIFVPKALAVTALLLIAGLLSLGVKPRTAQLTGIAGGYPVPAR